MAEAKLVFEDIENENISIYTENAYRENPTQAQKLIIQLHKRFLATYKDNDNGRLVRKS